jgi:hypothetical protein
VRGQGFGGGVFAGEFGFREYGVDLLVAGSTEENDGITFGPADVPAVSKSFSDFDECSGRMDADGWRPARAITRRWRFQSSPSAEKTPLTPSSLVTGSIVLRRRHSFGRLRYTRARTMPVTTTTAR